MPRSCATATGALDPLPGRLLEGACALSSGAAEAPTARLRLDRNPRMTSPARPSRLLDRPADYCTGAIRIATQVWGNVCNSLIMAERADDGRATRRPERRQRGELRNRAGAHEGPALCRPVVRGTVKNILGRCGVEDVQSVFRPWAATARVRPRHRRERQGRTTAAGFTHRARLQPQATEVCNSR